MELGKPSLVLEYPLQRIDRNIPAFHKELLSAWVKHEPCRLRTNVPTMATNILNEPLFLNSHFTLHDEVLFFKDWIAAGVIKISDICYEVVPGFLPVRAVHDILAGQLGNDGRTLDRTSRELNKIIPAIPQHCTKQICSKRRRPPPTLQPCFAIRTAGACQTSTDILSCRTRHFYGQLHDRNKPVVPAIDRWKASLQPEPVFTSKQWKTLYSPLVSNKQGDTNWKIAHRVLPTALSPNRMGQEKMRGQRRRLPVQPLGYVMSTKVIFSRAEVFRDVRMQANLGPMFERKNIYISLPRAASFSLFTKNLRARQDCMRTSQKTDFR